MAAPGPSYFAVFGEFYDGAFAEALQDFRREGRGGIKTIDSHWIDSICYHTMCGECCYQLGQMDEALDHYASALKLYLAFPTWMVRVQFPPTIASSAAPLQKPPPWGSSQRGAPLGHFPDRMPVAQGQIDQSAVIRFGGVVQQANLFPINVVEIVRCTSLALRRWRELMGPNASNDQLTKDLVLALSRRPAPPNHWSEAWVEVQLGLAYAAAGKVEQAKTSLERGLLVQGQFDHPLTATALYELGRLALAAGDLTTADRAFEEATYAAYFFPDPVLLEEAFQHRLTIQLLSHRDQFLTPLSAAAHWARLEDLRQLYVGLCVMAAENHLALGHTAPAEAVLQEGRASLGRRELAAARVGARLNFATAQLEYAAGRTESAQEALAAALAFQGRGSTRLLQVRLLDQAFQKGQSYTSGVVAPRLAMDLYLALLSEPAGADWTADPLEALSFLTTPHDASLENWFRAALERKDLPAAVEITELARRHRFLQHTELGGRLLGLRWLLEGPRERLSRSAELERQNLVLRYAEYEELSQQARTRLAELQAHPPIDDQDENRSEQLRDLRSLEKLVAQQEAVLQQIALRREPATITFPPLLSVKQLQARLPKGRLLLSFFSAGGRLYGAWLTADQMHVWQTGTTAADVQRRTARLLRELGLVEANRSFSFDQLEKDGWKTSAADLLNALLVNARLDLPGEFQELVVVPDAALWYVPFEILQVSSGESTEPLLSKLRVRYAPTLALAMADDQHRRPGGRTAVLLGRLHPRDSTQLAQEAFEDLGRVLPLAHPLRAPLPAAPAITASLFQRLIVLDDLAPAGPLDWSPLPAEKTASGTALGDWLRLPWAGPTELILPGFHSPAENALKQQPADRAGQEFFLSLTALMGSGARTVLISRWRPAGQTCLNLVREFTQELPDSEASECWQRAIFAAQGAPIDPDREPRVEQNARRDPPTAEHPFFWAGYLLADRGPAPEATADDAAAEALAPAAAPPAPPADLAPTPADDEAPAPQRPADADEVEPAAAPVRPNDRP